MNTNISFIEKLRWSFKTIEHKYLQYRLTTNETVVADTEYGKIKGVKRISVYDKPYFSFEGIPYAQPPVGELRFKAPQRPTPWEGTKDCTHTKDKAVQIQFVKNKVEGSEDCLYLNVYTNDLSPKTPRPVMVYIHGGGFIIGEANRDWHAPDYFMEKDVVLVTITYRLGVFGFLSLQTPELHIPGNAGLKDQVMALKWIKNNCASFGGNPDCITVFGESAGGASTHYMLITDQTQGLFHRGILMSGNALCHWALTNYESRAYTLAKLVGYKGDNNEQDVLKFLLTVKAEDLKRVEEKVSTQEDAKKDFFPFAPVIEPYETAECVISKHPREMMKNCWSNSIPVMMGNCSYEGLLFLTEVMKVPSVVNKLESCTDLLPNYITEASSADELKDYGLKIKKAHVSGEKPIAEDYLDYCSIAHFVFPMHCVIQSRFAYGAAPTYVYRFDFDSLDLINPYTIMRWGRGVKGVSHGDDISFLFWSQLARRFTKDSREYRAIERTVGIWTTFAATGNPYDEKIDGMDALTWDPVKKTDTVYKCLNISDELKNIDLPEMAKIKIWESIYEKHRNLLY